MFSRKKFVCIIVPLIILIPNLTLADWREDAKAIDISGGEDHTLVLTKNKWPWACGDNSWYQLGIGDDKTSQWSPVRVHKGDMNSPSDYLEDINDIDAGWQHSLALDVNGFVWAWGDNFYGQLGDNSRVDKDVPVQVHGPNDVNFLEDIIAISAGRSGEHSLAVDANNFVYAWGRNSDGQCGNDESGNYKLTPVKVKGVEGEEWLENIIAVSAGANLSMALGKLDPCDPNCNNCNGRVYTFGGNYWPYGGSYRDFGYGKLGNGTTVHHSDTPVLVKSGQQDPNDPNSYLKGIIAISAGWDHSMALEKYDPFDPNYQGRVYTWGSNGGGWDSDGGRLGNGTTDDTSTPVIVLSGWQDPNNPDSYLKGIVAISAGEGHSMALDIYGNVWTWGDNSHGQLGNGTDDPCTTPVKVVGLNGEGYLENIVTISAGFWHCLAINANGTI